MSQGTVPGPTAGPSTAPEKAAGNASELRVAALPKARARPIDFLKRVTQDSLAKSIVLMTALVLLAVGAVGVAVGLRIFSPRSQITVSAFELLGPADKSGSQGEKALADLTVDSLQNIFAQAERFEGNSFSSTRNFKSIPDMPQIPINTAFGIEIKGISLDQMLATWSHLRFHEYLISGDQLSDSSGKLILRLRYNTEGRANSVESQLQKPDAASTEEAIRNLSLRIVEEIHPEAAARYLLQQIYFCEENCAPAKQAEARTEATRFCRSWTKREPNRALPWFYLGYATMLSRHPADALAILERALRIDGRFEPALNTKGFLLLQGSKLNEAETAFQSALLLRKNPNPLTNLSSIRIRQGRYADAETLSRKALALDPEAAGAWFSLGSALLHLSRNREAADALRHLRDLRPDGYLWMYGLIVALARDGKLAEALEECRIAATLDPGSDYPPTFEGVALRVAGQNDRALQHFDEQIKRDAKNDVTDFEAYFQKAMVHQKRGELKEARVIFESLLGNMAVLPETAFLRARISLRLAKVLEAQGEGERGRQFARQAEQLEPGIRFEILDEL